MGRIGVALFAALLAAVPAAPAFAAQDLPSISRGRAAAASAKLGDAPFRAGGRDPLPELLLRQELDARGGPRGSCDNTASAVCYDMRDGRVVYRRARAFMPKIDGLTPESISLRRDRILFKYSF